VDLQLGSTSVGHVSHDAGAKGRQTAQGSPPASFATDLQHVCAQCGKRTPARSRRDLSADCYPAATDRAGRLGPCEVIRMAVAAVMFALLVGFLAGLLSFKTKERWCPECGATTVRRAPQTRRAR
jgi:predicted RNA-binding Zn-ribbon protein involved in translation (DUF1610 family)